MEPIREYNRKIHAYIAAMKPVFRERAVFSDETAEYRTPFEPVPGDTVTIRIRTARNNVDSVYFISGAVRKPMRRAFSRELPIDFYENANFLRLSGENLDGSVSQLVFYTARGLERMKDLTGKGPDHDRCGGHSH